MKARIPNLHREKKAMYTVSAYPGTRHFDEAILKKDGKELRFWDPKRSKLAAGIIKELTQTGISENDVVLYLGAGHGYTPSFVSDMVGKKGMVFCVEFSPRTMRDLLHVCEQRDNMAPILGDANNPQEYSGLLPDEVDVLFQDVAQKSQVEIFLKNMKFLKKGGFGLLAVKSRSIDVTRKPQEVFRDVRKELDEKVIVADYRELHPFEKDHAIFVCKNK